MSRSSTSGGSDHTLAWRVQDLERRLINTVDKTVYEADERRRETEHQVLRQQLEDVRGTIRWQGRTLILWVLAFLLSVGTAIAGIIL